MNRPETLNDYTRRLLRAVQLLAVSEAMPSLEQLAETAHFSPFHFHRIYRGILGETVYATWQRFALLRAARDLGQRSEWPVERVARRAGYGSSAAFVRAFAASYGVTPGAYRQKVQARFLSLTQKELTMYEVEYRDLAMPIRIATAPHQGDYLQINQAFGRLGMLAQNWGIPCGGRWFGLYYDDPQTVPTADLRSAAALEVPAGMALGVDACLSEIGARRYAVVEHRGPYSELTQAYQWLTGVWLPQSGVQLAEAPVVECYLNMPQNTAPQDLRTEIWLPLVE